MKIRLSYEWDRFDTAAVLAALHSSHEEHLAAGNPIAKLSNPAVAYQRLLSGEQDSLIVDGYLVVYDVGTLWSGDKTVVTEKYVLKVSNYPGPLSSVVKALTAVAEAHGCAGVCVGNASGDPRLSKFYESKGFAVTGTQFYKEL